MQCPGYLGRKKYQNSRGLFCLVVASMEHNGFFPLICLTINYVREFSSSIFGEIFFSVFPGKGIPGNLDFGWEVSKL